MLYKTDDYIPYLVLSFQGQLLTEGNSGSMFSPEYYFGLDVSRRFELMQFTGLKDRHGKEIWEGDVVRFVKRFVAKISIDPYRGVTLTYLQANARVKLIDEFTEPIPRNHEISLEVIGNIHENPELFKEKP